MCLYKFNLFKYYDYCVSKKYLIKCIQVPTHKYESEYDYMKFSIDIYRKLKGKLKKANVYSDKNIYLNMM